MNYVSIPSYELKRLAGKKKLMNLKMVFNLNADAKTFCD